MAVEKLKPTQPISGLEGTTILDFWSWAYSNILSNVSRAVFAEFVVGSALGVTDTPRTVWDAVDLRYAGKKIEVKSAAYVQSWEQLKPSTIIYDIGKKVAWDSETNVSSAEALRSADCYVFCLYPERDKAKANILDVHTWQFFVIPTTELEKLFANQKKVSLSRIANLVQPVGIDRLKEKIDSVLMLDTSATGGF